MPGAYEDMESPAPSLLPVHRTDVRDLVERAETCRIKGEGAVQRKDSTKLSHLGSSWFQRCYGSVQRIFGSNRGPLDEEAAVAGGTDPTSGSEIAPASFERSPSHRTNGSKTHSDAPEVEACDATTNTYHQPPSGHNPPSLAANSNPRLLSDEENDRLNRKIDRLMAAIDDRRPIHIVPGAETGEVEIFADHNDKDEFQQNIAAAPENFGRTIASGGGVRRIRSRYSLRHTDSTDSWDSTDSVRSSSNAWERAVAAANIRFALELVGSPLEATVIRKSIRRLGMEAQTRQRRPLVREISPIPLDYYKPLRTSTPSIHSNDSEQDTSSPLFLKSCERVRRENYAAPPESSFQPKGPEEPQLDDLAFISETRGRPPPNGQASRVPSSTVRPFGVFKDVSTGRPSSQQVGRQGIRSKALKDVSNLRRPGYFQFNSFAKDAESMRDQIDTAAPGTSSSTGFPGATDPASRRAYINTKWPGLLEGQSSSSMEEPPGLDGVARRRNEQAVGLPIDTSHYLLSHVRSSPADSSLNSDQVRQAHFDLAMARLEGRALPPPPSPIHRHADWAALADRDIRIEGIQRSLPLRVPTPSKVSNPQRVGPSGAVWFDPKRINFKPGQEK